MRHLEVFPDGRAVAEDRRFEQQGEIQLTRERLDSLMTQVRSVVTEPARFTRSGVADDFNFAIQLDPADEGDTLRVEGNGLAFPDPYGPVLKELMDLTGEALSARKEDPGQGRK
jgi:hypothetical protein